MIHSFLFLAGTDQITQYSFHLIWKKKCTIACPWVSF